jgi:hypothetical protein
MTARTTIPARPSAADITRAIDIINAGAWLEPLEQGPCWHCVAYGETGEAACSGDGPTATEGAALAWIGVWQPDALNNSADSAQVPLEISDGWRFELTPDWTPSTVK